MKSAVDREMGHYLSIEEARQQLLKQRGLCYYSGVPMRTEVGDYKISLERLDPRVTYQPDNVAFVCQEFQSGDRTRLKTTHSNEGSSGWSQAKYEIVMAAKEEIDMRDTPTPVAGC